MPSLSSETSLPRASPSASQQGSTSEGAGGGGEGGEAVRAMYLVLQ